MTESEVLVNLEQIQFPLRMAPLVAQAYQGVPSTGYTQMQSQAYQQAYEGVPPPAYTQMQPHACQQAYQGVPPLDYTQMQPQAYPILGYQPPYPNDTLSANIFPNPSYQKVTPTTVTQSNHVSSILSDISSCRFLRDFLLCRRLLSGSADCTACESCVHGVGSVFEGIFEGVFVGIESCAVGACEGVGGCLGGCISEMCN